MVDTHLRYPDGLDEQLEALVDEEEMFNSKQDAIRYFIRTGIQRTETQ